MYYVVETKSSYSIESTSTGSCLFWRRGHIVYSFRVGLCHGFLFFSPGSSFIFNVEWVQHSRNARVSISDLAQTIETVKAARRVANNPREPLRV